LTEYWALRAGVFTIQQEAEKHEKRNVGELEEFSEVIENPLE
jgi:hypothetical protein